MAKLFEQYKSLIRWYGLNTNKAVNMDGVTIDTSGNVVIPGTALITGVATFSASPVFNGGRNTPVNASSGNTSPTAAQSGQTFLFDTAAGITYTLPAPVVGATYSFIVTTSVTSSNHKVITSAGTVLLQGVIAGATTTATLFESIIGSSNISVTMNGSTTGGLVGTYLNFKCLSATLWQVDGMNFGSGSPATPFASS